MNITKTDGDNQKVWINDKEVPDWVYADEFRRLVTTPTKVLYGSVRIERVAPPVVAESVVTEPIAPVVAATPAPTVAPKQEERPPRRTLTLPQRANR